MPPLQHVAVVPQLPPPRPVHAAQPLESSAATAAPARIDTATPIDRAAAERAVTELLRALGHDPESTRLAATPGRVVDALHEFTSPRPFNVSTFANADGYDEAVLVRDISFVSLCEHHMLPFRGVAHVGYLPGTRIAGLSVLPHVVEHFSRSLQVQESLTTDIAEFLQQHLDARGVGVTIAAEHMCISARGVRAEGTTTVTQAFRGSERDSSNFRALFAL